MSDYIQYFLEPESLRRDIPDVGVTDEPRTAVQTKAQALLNHVLARNQFPEFHSKHPALPGPAVPSTPLVSPVLSPASAPVRIPTTMARVWIQRDPATGLPLAASLPFSWGQASNLPLTPGSEHPSAVSTTFNPTSPDLAQDTSPQPGQDALANPPLPPPALEVSLKQQRLLQLAAEVIELAQLPLDAVEAACGTPIQTLLFAYTLASKDGQLVHTPKAIPAYRHFLTLYHRWILRRYCRDRSLLVDWTSNLDCHVRYLDNILTTVSAETSPPLWTLYVALDLAQYYLATLVFSRAHQMFTQCQALVAAHQDQVQPWVQQVTREGFAACQQALHPPPRCPKSMDDPTAMFLWVESGLQASLPNSPNTRRTLPEACGALDWTALQAWLLADIIDQHLTRAYRATLVHRCVVAQQPCAAAAVDLCNFMDALYNQLELSPTLCESTQTWLTQQPLPKALGWVQLFLISAMHPTQWQRPHRPPVNADRFASVIGFTCNELERLLNAPQKLGLMLQLEPDALYHQAYTQICSYYSNQSHASPLTTRILVPSIYKTNDPSPTVLIKLSFELLVKESYQSASATLNRLLSIQASPSTAASNQGPRNPSQMTAKATEQLSPSLQEIQFYLTMTRVLLLTTVPTGQADDTLWAQLLDDILQQHAQLPFKVVLRLALYCIQRHRWADIVRVIRWITQHKQDFVQHEDQMKLLSVVTGISLVMEKFMLAAIPINELIAGAVNTKAPLPAYARTIPNDILRDIQESVFQTILSITSLHHEVRQELITGIRKHVTDPQVAFVTAALFAGILLPPHQTNCLYLLGWLPLVTALPVSVKNSITDDATLHWLHAFQPATATKYPSITLGGKLHVTRLVADLCDKMTASTAVAVKNEHGFDKVSCHLVLSELYFSVRRYKCSLRAFTTALTCQPWSEAHPYFKEAANWNDCYLFPAISACSLLHEPFLSVLISQLGQIIDYTTMFPLLDKVFGSSRPLNQYPWHLIHDSNLLEYIIHYMSRNHHEPLAQELSTHISRISTLQAPNSVWYANPWFRQRLANYLCSAIERLTH